MWDRSGFDLLVAQERSSDDHWGQSSPSTWPSYCCNSWNTPEKPSESVSSLQNQSAKSVIRDREPLEQQFGFYFTLFKGWFLIQMKKVNFSRSHSWHKWGGSIITSWVKMSTLNPPVCSEGHWSQIARPYRFSCRECWEGEWWGWENEGWIKEIKKEYLHLQTFFSLPPPICAKGLFISPSELSVSLLSLSFHPARAHMWKGQSHGGARVTFERTWQSEDHFVCEAAIPHLRPVSPLAAARFPKALLST